MQTLKINCSFVDKPLNLYPFSFVVFISNNFFQFGSKIIEFIAKLVTLLLTLTSHLGSRENRPMTVRGTLQVRTRRLVRSRAINTWRLFIFLVCVSPFCFVMNFFGIFLALKTEALPWILIRRAWSFLYDGKDFFLLVSFSFSFFSLLRFFVNKSINEKKLCQIKLGSAVSFFKILSK